MFILRIEGSGSPQPPKTVTTPEAKPSSGSESSASAQKSQGADSVTIKSLDEAIKEQETNFSNAKDPIQAIAIKQKITELKASKLELATKNGTVTTKDIEDFLKDNPLNQPLSKEGNEKHRKYSEILIEALEKSIGKALDKEDFSQAKKLDTLKGSFKTDIEYRKELLKQIEAQRKLLKDITDLSKNS